MWGINLKIAGVVIGTLAFYTLLANSIPQVQSEVPRAIAMGPDVTPEQLVHVGEQVYNGAGGCTACHGLGTRAPNLLLDERGTGSIGARCGRRESGKSCKEYLHEALVKPAAFVAPGYQPIMPDMSRQLPPEQIWALVAYLESLGGTVDVSGSDIAASGGGAASGGAGEDEEEESGAGGGGGGGGFLAGGSTKPQEILNAGGCLGCHQVAGQGGSLGPDLSHIGGKLNAAQIRQAILDPAADTAAGFEALAAVMPTTFGQQMSAGQLESLVRFLGAQR
jgi:mono/diheme cytochrome c family protein